MARLCMRLFGTFQVTLDGAAVSGFASDKVRALLIYLAIESDQPQRREKLAGLLWPDFPEASAHANLRTALANLRQVIGDASTTPPYLFISRQTIQFNRASGAWIDVDSYTELLNLADLTSLEQAARLYRGDLLEGFSLGDASPFEEWALLERERYRRLALDSLYRLADSYGQRGEYEQALPHAWRQVELDPWHESAHQQLMRLLALSGRRTDALVQYETCCRLLAEELGVPPAERTVAIYEQIRSGRLAAAEPRPLRAREHAVIPPPFLERDRPAGAERPLFIARGAELAQLSACLDLAITGQGRVLFICGEAGSGKTALMAEFARRATETHYDLLVAGGECSAYSGLGDPYLPVRGMLAMLTGDLDAQWAGGAIGLGHARRLWDAMPTAIETLLDCGPQVLDLLLQRKSLLARASLSAHSGDPWLERLRRQIDQLQVHSEHLDQSQLFQQTTDVLHKVSRTHPLLLILDDLQWADTASISLLFHLGRRLQGSRILLLAAYRPEEVDLGRGRERHPLEPVVNELQRDFGNIIVDLDQVEGRGFIEALLDSEPNRLGAEFREMFYRQTQGNPLFTVELLRGLQEQGNLVQDREGRWIEGAMLDWERLPARVEAVIAERTGRLSPTLRAALRVASVEGEIFTAEAVARVQAADVREITERLSSELDRRHRLVRAQGILRIEGKRLSRYRFRHILFQKYLYNSLDEVERAHLHEAVGNTLEALYGGQAERLAAMSGQLAWHFQEADMTAKAIGYLQQAGENAIRLCAYEEAVAHLSRGLLLLSKLPDSAERASQELALQLSLGMAWLDGAPVEMRDAYSRARELCELTGQTSKLCQALGELSLYYCLRAEHQRARQLAEQALSHAQSSKDPLLIALGHWYLGLVNWRLGEFTAARAHFEQTISYYHPQLHHRPMVLLRGSDAGLSALAYNACCLWCLGYPEQASKQSQEALNLARKLNHSFSLADVMCYAGCVFNKMRRDARALKDCAGELERIAQNMGFEGWSVAATSYRGEALSMLGEVEEGLDQQREGLAGHESLGRRLYKTGALRSLAEAQARAGYLDEGLATLAEALTLLEETGERHWEAELYRLHGELLLAREDEAEAELSMQKAIEVARRQSAKSWELRATTNLCRLWKKQGKREEARLTLAQIYNWFTEGFDTTDLKEAKALLEELA
jgi:DNA-binding SARP family transcriptional activator/predicted ATPase